MKKVLSIVLVLMMVFAAVACSSTPAPAANEPKADQPAKTEEPAKAEEPAKTEEPAKAEEPAAAEPVYAALGLQLKNKTGATINELYITPVGEEKGNSVVLPGWQDKDADKDNYEKFIYIVRPEGVEFEITAVYADGTNASKTSALNMYDEISFKGTAADDWEIEPTKEEDHAAIDLAVALGMTADRTYPGYVAVAAEVKNKTGKNIKEFYLYEEGGDPKAYHNMVQYLYTNDGVKLDTWAPGKAKEGGKYVFSFFLRPEAKTYLIDLVFEDGTTITGESDEWFKPDGDGHQINEISMKSSDDPDVWEYKYDDGTDDDLKMPMDERLAYEMTVVGASADVWYPTYGEAPAVDAETLEAARQQLAHDASPLLDNSAAEAPAEPAPETLAAAAVPEGYTGISLLIKNKTGREIAKVYLYPVGEDKGKNVLKNVVESLPTEDESKEGNPHEAYAYVLRETAKLDAMELCVRYAGDEKEEVTWALKDVLAANTTITLKESMDDWKQKETDDADDLAAMAELAAKGEPTDGVMPEAAAAEPAPEAAAETAEYTALGLKFKNRYGKGFKEAYIHATGEDRGANVLSEVLPTEGEGPEDSEEVILFIYRETAKLEKMSVTIVTVDGEEFTWDAPSALGNNFKITVKADINDWSFEEITKEKDLNKIAEFVAAGVTSDGFVPAN